jgi:hypothetical protein
MQEIPKLKFKISEDSIFHVYRYSKLYLSVTNYGSKPSPRISMIINSPEQINVSPEKRQIGSLDPGRSRQILYRIRPKMNGDFALPITILITSKNLLIYTYSIELHVGSNQKNTVLKEIIKKERRDEISPETPEKRESVPGDQKIILNLTCPLCGEQYEQDSKFCSSCGTNLKLEQEKEQEKICPICGRLVSIKALFCGSCGTKFD